VQSVDFTPHTEAHTGIRSIEVTHGLEVGVEAPAPAHLIAIR